MIWKKFILVIIIALFSVANSFETLNYFYQKYQVVSVLDVKDFEEKNSESEKSDEKTDKLSYVERGDSHHNFIFCSDKSWEHSNCTRINFSSSDYSQVVYSPPELA